MKNKNFNMSKFLIIFIIIFSGGQALQASSTNTLVGVTPLNLFRSIVINFQTMNYQKIYDDLVSKAKSENRKKKQGVYYENHHIIPTCMGGLDSKENLVLLAGREHFIAHHLLVRIYPDNKELMYPLWMMSNKVGVGRDYTVSSRTYERIKAEYSKLISEKRKGKLPPGDGLEKARLANIGRVRSKEERRATSIANTGKVRSEEARKKYREAIRPKVKKESIDKIKEALSKVKEIECPFCHKISRDIGNMVQYHFDNCKQNPNYIDKREELTCPHCGFKSRNKGNILYHHFDNCKKNPNFDIEKHNNKLNILFNKMRDTLKKKDYIKCVWCDFKSTSVGLINLNHNDNCKQNPNYIEPEDIYCELCDFKSKSIGGMKQHINRKHKNI